MITIKAGRKTIELYGSIKELPIKRHKQMQQYLLQDAGIGNDIASVDERLAHLISFLEAKKYDEVKEELANLRYTFFSTIAGLDFKCRAFACFIYSVNKKIQTDFSAEGITELVKNFDDMSLQELEKHWDGIKKKLIQNSEHTSQDGSDLTLNTLKG